MGSEMCIRDRGVTKSLLDSDLADQKFVACKNKKVLVIGGGDTGNDCVGTAIRLGASSVIQLEMMPKAPDQRAANNPWPEWPRVCKTDYGQQEAIAVFGHDPRIYQTTVKEFIADDKGRLKKAVLVKLQSKKDEKTGRMMMVPVEGSEWTVEVDVVLILSLIHISEPTRRTPISYAVFCLKKKKKIHKYLHTQ